MNGCVAFDKHRMVASGTLPDVAAAVRAVGDFNILIFDNATGAVVDLDPRGEPAVAAPVVATNEPRGRGRPKLGVVAREVTLLPRHWEWLSTQPGGASVAIRKLVEEARRTNADKDRARAAQEAAYRFMSAIAGDLPGFEEAARALFAYDRTRFCEMVAGWPEDVRNHAVQLAFD